MVRRPIRGQYSHHVAFAQSRTTACCSGGSGGCRRIVPDVGRVVDLDCVVELLSCRATLTPVSPSMSPEEFMGRRHVLAIRQHPDVESERVHYLQAPSEQDARSWAEALHGNRLTVLNAEITGLREVSGMCTRGSGQWRSYCCWAYSCGSCCPLSRLVQPTCAPLSRRWLQTLTR